MPAVRAGLADAGVVVPASTWFVAAVHDTTRDRVEILDEQTVPVSHHDVLARLVADLAVACDGVVAERYAALPDAPRTSSHAAIGGTSTVVRSTGRSPDPSGAWRGTRRSSSARGR